MSRLAWLVGIGLENKRVGIDCLNFDVFYGHQEASKTFCDEQLMHITYLLLLTPKKRLELSCECFWMQNIFIVAGMAIKKNINNQDISISRDPSNHSQSLAETVLRSLIKAKTL